MPSSGWSSDPGAYSWGLNSHGQLGLGDTTTRRGREAGAGGDAAGFGCFAGQHLFLLLFLLLCCHMFDRTA